MRTVLYVTLACAAGGTWVASAASAADCEGDPLFITDDCDDPRFNDPVIDVPAELRTDPVPHYYVHGFFAGTDARFSFYFPPPEQYEGRFFLQTHQTQGDENFQGGSSGGTLANNVPFAFASGGYYVRTNLGGNENPLLPLPVGAADTSIRGYRVNTAAARFSREVANDFYAESHGEHRPYGYIYGGSGGSYMTICSLQQTRGIWDGGVPFIMANHMATPYTYNVRIHVLRLLRDTGVNQFPAVMDAIDPGGSGDPYATLNEEQAEALRDATNFGFPPRGWWDWANMTQGALSLTALEVPIQDPTYAEDFWTVPGYAGFDDPFGTLASVRINESPGERIVLQVGSLPPQPPFFLPPGLVAISGDLSVANGTGAYLIADDPLQAGDQWPLVAVFPLGPGATGVFPFAGAFGFPPLTNVQANDPVHVDNSLVIGLQYYNRYQDPNGDPEYYAWDAWRDENGDPIYVQRDVITGLERASSSAGCVESGEFQGKMAVVNNLIDIDATPWYADWYRLQVEKQLGNKTKDHYRLYYNDNAMHTSPDPDNLDANARIVNYSGMLQQTVRDVAAWVEDGVKPLKGTNYSVQEGTAQIVVPPTAGERKGLQPVITLTVNGGERADISVGDSVSFRALIQVPPGSGKVTSAEFDFYGVGDYPQPVDIGTIRPSVEVELTHTYDTPGTYFPVLRARSQRDGDPNDAFTQVNNLDRVRVVVSE